MSSKEIKYAHLGWRNTPGRVAAKQNFRCHVDEIWAEQETENEARRGTLGGPGLQIADRYLPRTPSP